MAVITPRRYWLLKSRACAARGEEGLALAFLSKHRDAPGTALPDDFPSRPALVAAGYTVLEDLQGATVEELVEDAMLSRRDAELVLAAVT